MQDFPANSKRAKERSDELPGDEPKRIQQVTSAEAVRRKRGVGKMFKETFIGGDARTTLEYMTTEVVIPGIRDMVFDAFQSGLERMIYGESRIKRGGSHYSPYSNVGHVNYQGMSSNRPPPTSNRMLSQRSRARHDFGEIVIQSRQEAEEVLDRLFDELSRYGSVPVSVLYELTGIQSSHTDHKWGWNSLRGSKVARLRTGGFLLDLPNPEPLDR